MLVAFTLMAERLGWEEVDTLLQTVTQKEMPVKHLVLLQYGQQLLSTNRM